MRASPSLATFMFMGLVVAAAACGSSGVHQAAGTGGKDTGGKGTGGTATSSTATSSTGTGGKGAGGGEVTDAGNDGNTTGDKFPFPLVAYGGASLIAAPNVVTITFQNDPLGPQVAQLGNSIASSPYWDTVRAGYCGNSVCIGDGPMGTSVVLPMDADASYTDSAMGGPSTVQTLLAGLITANTVPQPDANTIYALYFPTATTVTLDDSPSCLGFDGYHNQMTMGAQQVVFAVINECTAPMMTPPITLLQNTTITTSHEIAEAASDGVGTQNLYGFYINENDPTVWGWSDVQGGEIGDLCVDPFLLAQDEVLDGAFTVQRIWSVDNAAAGKNPCVPIPAGEVYFSAYPSATVLVMDVGKSKTIEVTALADGPMAAWTLTPQDWTDFQTTYLSFSIEGGTTTDAGPEIQVKSGDKIQLTVTLVADAGKTANQEADGALVSANGTNVTATLAHFWPFVVLTPKEAAAAGATMMRRHAGHPRKPSHGKRRGRGLSAWR